MNNLIVYFEGANDVGKSTLLERLSRENFVQNFELGTTEKLQDYSWWFHESSPFELIDEILKLVIRRDLEIYDSCKSRICLVDKGYKTLFSRLKATFLLRGGTDDELEKYMRYFKKKYPSNSSLFSKEILLLPELSSISKPTSEDRFFSRYNSLQRKILIGLNYDYILKYYKYPEDKEYRLILNYIHQRN